MQGQATLELPATALSSDAKGLRAAVGGEGGVLHFVPIVIERDTGATIAVASFIDGQAVDVVS
jgi:hypothetical protein